MSLYPPNKPSQYPKTKYHPNGGSITVTDHAHELLFGPPWSDNPLPESGDRTPKGSDQPKPTPGKPKGGTHIEGGGGGTWPA